VEKNTEQVERIVLARVVVIFSERVSTSSVRIVLRIAGDFGEVVCSISSSSSESPLRRWYWNHSRSRSIMSLEKRSVRRREAILSCARLRTVVRRKEEKPPPITIRASEVDIDVTGDDALEDDVEVLLLWSVIFRRKRGKAAYTNPH